MYSYIETPSILECEDQIERAIRDYRTAHETILAPAMAREHANAALALNKAIIDLTYWGNQFLNV